MQISAQSAFSHSRAFNAKARPAFRRTRNRTKHNYDHTGNLIGTTDPSDHSTDITLVNTASGEVLNRLFYTKDSNNVLTAHTEETLIVDGNALGTSSDTATELASAGAGTTPFSFTYEPIAGDAASSTIEPTTYVVNAGDTLPSIAKAAYGDASLWVQIADANGLTGATALTAGQVLILPSQTQLNTNGPQTYKPYNAERRLA